MTVSITGLDLIVLGQAARQAVGRELYLSGQEIMAESRDECPVDTGNLRRSGQVIQDADGAVELSYPVDYAVYVHENLEANHPIGKAKFLEDPVNRALPELPQRIAEAILGSMEAGAR